VAKQYLQNRLDFNKWQPPQLFVDGRVIHKNSSLASIIDRGSTIFIKGQGFVDTNLDGNGAMMFSAICRGSQL
jgi:hypothetical protein